MSSGEQKGNPSFEYLGEGAVESLNFRQRVALARHRTRFIKWLRVRGKDPRSQVGYAEGTIENYARRYHQIHRWIWNEFGGFTLRIPAELADEFIESLHEDRKTRRDGNPYSATSKRKFSDVLKAYFRWRRDRFNGTEWQPPIEFEDGSPSNPADYFTKEERRRLYDASLQYRSVPSYNNLSPEDRDRWKAYISQILGKPKQDVRPEDFQELNQSWKIPSLIGSTLDAGFRPCEINQINRDWLSLNKYEIHIPREHAAKNREDWHVAIRERTARDLQNWIDQRACKTKYDDSERLWLNQRGNPYTSKTLNSLLDNLLDEAGIDADSRKLVWYSFRKSTGQYLHEISDQLTTATQLRHKDQRSVRHYAQPTPEQRRGYLRDIDG